MLPMEATEPTLPMDSTELREPIDSRESVDHSDQARGAGDGHDGIIGQPACAAGGRPRRDGRAVVRGSVPPEQAGGQKADSHRETPAAVASAARRPCAAVSP
jgi:hypothetical protein